MVLSMPRKETFNSLKVLHKSEKISTTDKIILPKSPLFGTDGIRGKVGDILTQELALQVGFCAGLVLKDSSGLGGAVIVGQDSRNSSDMLAAAIASGLTAAGLEVWNLGLCPTPCVAYLTKITEAIGGIMISASHNPPEDNGIKFFSANGTKLVASEATKIESLLRSLVDQGHCLKPQSSAKYYQRSGLVQEYMNGLYCSLPKELSWEGIRIVLDLAWGASVKLAPQAFRQLGAEVICLHDQPNGDRINVDCGSTHLARLQAAVQENQADLGFAFDGDADRVMAIDAQGRVVDGDYILYLWGKQLKEENQLPDNLIIATVMANLGFENAWGQLGGKLIRTAVGDQNVQEAMWNNGAVLGGEQSGHILCHHHSFSGDGLQTALHLTALVQNSGVSLADLVDQSFQTYPQILRNVRVEDRERRLGWKNCQEVQQAIAKAEEAMGAQGRILVRASGTEPVIRVMVEAESASLANHWTEELVSTVRQHLAA
jgi:phosphoglucosamine mutase